MIIFNSLGSNYDFRFALRALFSVGGAGAKKALREYLEERYGGRAILTAKGRDALALALRALIGGKKGARVAINGFTCIALYEAVVKSGYEPVFLDINQGGLDFSPEALQLALEHNAINAVVIQNTLGIPCRAREVLRICKERNVFLIEDLAHSIGATYESDGEAGTLGDAVVLSFSQDKVVDAVSGGALILRNNTENVEEPSAQVSEWRQYREYYYPMLTWKIRTFYGIGIGKLIHFVARALHLLPRPLDSIEGLRTMPGWQAKLIRLQFGSLEKVAMHRKQIAEVYTTELKREIQVPRAVVELGRSANLRFPILIEHRDGLIAHLRGMGVYVSDIWYDAPIAPQKYLDRTSYKKGDCPQAEFTADRILNLPTHINVSVEQAHRIAKAVNAFLLHA